MVNALRTQILTGSLSGFDENDVAEPGDFDIFNGSHRWAVVLDYFNLEGVRAEFGASFEHTWEIEVTLGVPMTNIRKMHDDLASLRDHLLVRIGTTPDLAIASNLVNAEVIRGESIEDLIEWGGTNWQFETLTVAARELVEYDDA